MKRPAPHRALARVFESDAQIAEWTQRQRREAALTRLLRQYLPRPIAERTRVTDAREGRLEIAAGSGAIAAALRQRAPDLRTRFARDGHPFVEIRIRVQLVQASEVAPTPARRPWSSS